MSEHREEHTLPAVHALHLVEVAARWNVTAEELFAPFDLRADALADPRARLPLATIEALVERARALTGEPGLGIHLGLQMRVSAHGYLGFAAMTAATAREALELATRFAPTRTSALGLRLHVSGDVASLVIEEHASLGAARDAIIFALLIGIWQIGEALTGRSLDGGADVAFPKPAYWSRFERVSNVRFDAPVNQLVFPASVLDLPLTFADPAALRLAREQCERELESTPDELVVATVRRLLPHDERGFRTLDEVADQMHVSPRTLKRKLAAVGKAYSDLLDEQRRDRALLLLRTGDLSLEEVAERVGYSDVANFTRAFRRWTGKTPTAFRRPSEAKR